jgi:hypothetical protein
MNHLMAAFFVSWCLSVLVLFQLRQFRIQVIQSPLQERAVSLISTRFHGAHSVRTCQQDALSFRLLFDFARTRLVLSRLLRIGLAFADLIFYGFAFPATCHTTSISPLQ